MGSPRTAKVPKTYLFMLESDLFIPEVELESLGAADGADAESPTLGAGVAGVETDVESAGVPGTAPVSPLVSALRPQPASVTATMQEKASVCHFIVSSFLRSARITCPPTEHRPDGRAEK